MAAQPNPSPSSSSAAEEMDVLMTVLYDLEEQKDLELRYCVFDALFGSASQVQYIYVATIVLCYGVVIRNFVSDSGYMYQYILCDRKGILYWGSVAPLVLAW